MSYYLTTITCKAVHSITADNVARIDEKMAHEGLSFATRKHARTVVTLVLDCAASRAMVPRTLVADSRGRRRWSADVLADVPDLLPATAAEIERKRARVEAKAIEPEELRRVLDVTAEHRDGVLVAFLAFTGARRGEALGLSWTDVDLDAGLTRIRHNLAAVQQPDAGTVMHLTTTKTVAGVRTIRLDPALVSALRTWHARQAAERLAAGTAWAGPIHGTDRDGFPITCESPIFTDEIGRPVSIHRLRRVTAEIGQAAGLTANLTPHTLRHAVTSILLAEGVQIEAVAAHLGHADARVTAEVYAHALNAGRDEAGTAIGRVVGG